MDFKSLSKKERTVLGISGGVVLFLVLISIVVMSSNKNQGKSLDTSDKIENVTVTKQINASVASDLTDAYDNMVTYVRTTPMQMLRPKGSGSTDELSQEELETLKAFLSPKNFDFEPYTLGTDEKYTDGQLGFYFYLLRESDNQRVTVTGIFDTDTQQITSLSFDTSLKEV